MRSDIAFADIEASRDVASLRAGNDPDDRNLWPHPCGLSCAAAAQRSARESGRDPFPTPVEWIERYRSKRYFEFDPIVLSAARSIIPVDWERIDISRAACPRPCFVRPMISASTQRGLTVPIRGHRGDLAIFTVTSALQPAEWRRRKAPPIMRDMQLLGHYVHQRVARHERRRGSAGGPPCRSASSKCLQWAQLAPRSRSRPDKVGLSERAVRGYLDSARHKLSSLTKGPGRGRGRSISASCNRR